jgi:hypothetical protein
MHSRYWLKARISSSARCVKRVDSDRPASSKTPSRSRLPLKPFLLHVISSTLPRSASARLAVITENRYASRNGDRSAGLLAKPGERSSPNRGFHLSPVCGRPAYLRQPDDTARFRIQMSATENLNSFPGAFRGNRPEIPTSGCRHTNFRRGSNSCFNDS